MGPRAQDVTEEETGANTETDKQFLFNAYTELLADVEARAGMTETETYEEWAKALFTTIGTRAGWQARLAAAGLTVRGHRVVRAG